MRLSSKIQGVVCVATAGALLAVAANGCDRSDETAETNTATGAVTAKYDWLQFGGDARHTSNNTIESLLNQQNVSGLKLRFKVTLPATVQGSPVVLSQVSTASGVRDLVFVTTRNGDILALDADTGATVWSHANAGTGPTVAVPAVDPSRAFVYSYGLDGKVHKYAVGDGAETIGGGWPQVTTVKTNVEKGGSALAIATVGGTSFLYAPNGGYIGDAGNYQGHVTTINLATGAQKVFNMMCSDRTTHLGNGAADCAGQKSAVWAKAGIVFHPDTGKIYAVTGNGTFNASARSWGDSIVALNADGSGANGGPVDSYTPSNFQSLQDTDQDLGSTQPAILPGSSKFPHIAVQSGKDSRLRVINLDNLSGQGGPGHIGGELFATNLPQGGSVQNAVATWIDPADGTGWVFVVAPGNGIAAARLTFDASGNPSLASRWTAGGGGGGAVVANNVLFYGRSNALVALNPATGAQLWSGPIGAVRFQSPVVANGAVFITDNSNNLTAFSLPGTSSDGGVDAPVDSPRDTPTDTPRDTPVLAATRINCGGAATGTYAVDGSFSGGMVINHANTIDTTGLTDPAPQPVYQTARIANFSYTLSGFAAASSHTVRLHFAETYFNIAGARVFNVDINGGRVLTNFDVFGAAGSRSNKAVIRSFTATASAAGSFVIRFTSVVNNSLVSGIEIQ